MALIRLDRLLTLYFFYPLKRIRSRSREPRIPILMYHSVSEGRQEGVRPYYETTTSSQVFAEHMKFLHENEYSVIDFGYVARCLKRGKRIEQKTVVITFDDGFHDFYTQAFPVLQRYRFSATVFLPTGFIRNVRRSFSGKECITWNEVRELHGKGVTFGSHTVTHPRLSLLELQHVEFELKHSKERIQNEIGEPIDSFSYPFAFPEEDKHFTANLRVLMQSVGYNNGVTTTIGTITPADNLLFLKRIPINSFDDLPLFRAKLDGAYDWLHQIQYLFKRFIKNDSRVRPLSNHCPTS